MPEIELGSRVSQSTPQGLMSIAIVVLMLMIGIGIYHRARERASVLDTAKHFLNYWQQGDYNQLKDLYGNPGAGGTRIANKTFMPSADLESFEVPLETRTKPDTSRLPMVFVPDDWKGRRDPWIVDLSKIDGFEVEKVLLWRHKSLGAVAATVTIHSNRGPLKRRVVIACLTESSRCPITYVQVLPPGMISVYDF